MYLAYRCTRYLVCNVILLCASLLTKLPACAESLWRGRLHAGRCFHIIQFPWKKNPLQSQPVRGVLLITLPVNFLPLVQPCICTRGCSLLVRAYQGVPIKYSNNTAAACHLSVFAAVLTAACCDVLVCHVRSVLPTDTSIVFTFAVIIIFAVNGQHPAHGVCAYCQMLCEGDDYFVVHHRRHESPMNRRENIQPYQETVDFPASAPSTPTIFLLPWSSPWWLGVDVICPDDVGVVSGYPSSAQYLRACVRAQFGNSYHNMHVMSSWFG